MADVRQLEVLLKLLHSVGSQLAEAEGAYHRAWGRHLLEDWRGLELLTDKLRTTGLDEVEEVPATESLVEETPVQATGV
jgi:hypothetical protein